jgi:LysR family transcriptional regulator, nitrogen assimilation regulatory protein
MNLRQIEFFVHVAESGSFSRASALVGLTHPAVSRQVSALEHELKLRLLHRNGRGVLLTDAGRRFLVYARGILHQLDGARHAVTGSEADLAGKVAIGLPPSLGQVLTMPLVKAFRERYRSAELAIMEALSVPLQERLLAGRVDVAVIHNPTPSPLLKIEPMLTESVCLLSPARGMPRGARTEAVPFRTLEQFELIFPGAPHPIRSLVEAEALRRGIKLRVILEIDAIGMILQLVAKGYGHAIVPYNVVRAGMSGAGIVARPIVQPSLGSTVALVMPARRPSTLLADGVADILRKVLQHTLQRRDSLPRRRAEGERLKAKLKRLSPIAADAP